MRVIMPELEDWFEQYNGWSFSKHNLWNTCKLAFYYRYIGTALKVSDNIDIKKLKELKELSGKHMLKGKIIHDIIENQISLFKSGREMNENTSSNLLEIKVEQARKTAKNTVTEFFNGGEFDDSFFDNMRSTGTDQISIFFNVIWPQYKDYRYIGHEKLETIELDDVKCMVKADYICETKDGTILVSDWKTGKENPKYESELQIGGYALYAKEKYGKEPDMISSELVYLTSGAIRPFSFSAEKLKEIKNKIKTDYNEMNSSYDINSFEPNPGKWRCPGCNFASICSHAIL